MAEEEQVGWVCFTENRWCVWTWGTGWCSGIAHVDNFILPKQQKILRQQIILDMFFLLLSGIFVELLLQGFLEYRDGDQGGRAQDLCLLEAPDVLWPEDFDPQRHAEVCHFFWWCGNVGILNQWVVLVLGKWKSNNVWFSEFLGECPTHLKCEDESMRLLSRSVSERVQERGWMTENHLNEFGMGHPTLSWRVPRFQQKSHEFLRTSWKSLWISDVKTSYETFLAETLFHHGEGPQSQYSKVFFSMFFS